MSKLVSFAGVSRVNGELKFRTANDIRRLTQLQKLGDTEVELRFLQREMTRQEAAKELLAMNFANGRQEIVDLLNSVANETVKVAKPKTVTITVPTTFDVKVRGAKIKSTAPFGGLVFRAQTKKPVTKPEPDVVYSPKESARIRAEFMKKLKAAYEAN